MLRLLDSCIRDRDELKKLRSSLEKTEKICGAVAKGACFAEIIGEPHIIESLRQSFGDEELNSAIQFLARMALSDFTNRSFTLVRGIDNQRKFDFLYRTLGGWKQFQLILAIQLPNDELNFIQPKNAAHWKELAALPAGTLVTAYARTLQGKRSRNQESLALERCEAVFDTVQDQSATFEAKATPAVERAPSARPIATAAKKKAPTPARNWGTPSNLKTPSGPPVYSLKVTINKMDTFVHAGNAHLIITHMRDYAGKITLGVLRGEKQNVQLDADSIWGAEIRNGETVVFDFYGPVPQENFVKELAKKVNKYTQMDKVANE